MAGIFGLIKGLVGKNKSSGQQRQTPMDQWRSRTDQSALPMQSPQNQALDELADGNSMDEDPMPMRRSGMRRY
jgi:hypothetical protein